MKGAGWKKRDGKGKRDKMDGEAERWNRRRSPQGEMGSRLNGRSVLNHFSLTLSLSLLGYGLRAHIFHPLCLSYLFLLSLICTAHSVVVS